ncbi:YesK family protein [Priestia aryabhattai]|uniref:YesK family protein n=1 Tax=Priestia aryabhattai TaxID=412384 RepID=UPI0015F52BBB|nr:YesK family protein [Priestia aryabhattai]
MGDLQVVSTIIIAGLIALSYAFSRKKPTIKYITPLIVGVVSVGVVIVSFLIGGWIGMRIGTISFTAFISSLISLLIISIAESVKRKFSKNIHH